MRCARCHHCSGSSYLRRGRKDQYGELLSASVALVTPLGHTRSPKRETRAEREAAFGKLARACSGGNRSVEYYKWQAVSD